VQLPFAVTDNSETFRNSVHSAWRSVSPRPHSDDSQLPGVGQPVEVLGTGLTLTVVHVTDWHAPAFVSDPRLVDEVCDVRITDKFVAVEIRLLATAAGARTPVLLFAFQLGPPHDSLLVGVNDNPYRLSIQAPCSPGAFDPEGLPIPRFNPPDQMRLGETSDGWILFAVQPQVFASGHLVMRYYPAGLATKAVEIRLRP
jgi:hypothetical protein